MIKEGVQQLLEVVEKVEKGEINFEEILMALSPEEKSVLNVLAKRKCALNSNEIRNALVDDFIKLMFYYVDLNKFEEEIRKYQQMKEESYPNPLYIITKEQTVNVDRLISKLVAKQSLLSRKKPRLEYWKGNFEDVPELFLEAYNKLRTLGVVKNDRRILDRDKEKVAKTFRDLGIVDIPVRITIQRILEELCAAGLVISRQDIRGKGKKRYFLNPRLLKYI